MRPFQMYKKLTKARLIAIHLLMSPAIEWLLAFKLQPAIFLLSQHVIRFHKLPEDTTKRFLQ